GSSDLDAVVDQRQFTAADVRVRVGFGDAAVRGPAGVADADLGGAALGLRGAFHLRHAPGPAHAVHATVAQHGDAGRVIAAVFQALEALDQDGNHIAVRDGADNSAHIGSFLRWTD